MVNYFIKFLLAGRHAFKSEKRFSPIMFVDVRAKRGEGGGGVGGKLYYFSFPCVSLFYIQHASALRIGSSLVIA